MTNGDSVYILGDMSMRGRNVNLVLSHYPIFSWKDMGRGTVLLYGHTHDSDEDRYYQKCIAGMYSNECRHVKEETGAAMAYNVGCMKQWMNYSPRTLKEILDYNDIID